MLAVEVESLSYADVVRGKALGMTASAVSLGAMNEKHRINENENKMMRHS